VIAVEIGLRDSELQVDVKFFGGLRLVAIDTRAADEVVDTGPGWVTTVALGVTTVEPSDVGMEMGSALSLVMMVVAP
jgi:hypothetical protein